MLTQPDDAALGHVLAEVVILVVGRLNGGGVLHQAGLPLGGFTGEEAVEVIEAVTRRPAIERPHGGGLIGWGVVPLAEGRRLVAVVMQHFGHGGRGFRNHTRVAIPVDGPFGDRAVAHSLVIASGEQGRPGGGADSGGVKGVVAQALVRQFAEGGGVDLAAERGGLAEADVIQQHDQHVGCIGF